MRIMGSCHCGETRFEVSDEPQLLLQCDCSFCSKSGAVWACYPPHQFRLTTPGEASRTYRWGGGATGLHFCGTCGCSTYNDTFDWETGAAQISVNALLFDAFDLATVPVETNDGRGPFNSCPAQAQAVSVDRCSYLSSGCASWLEG